MEALDFRARGPESRWIRDETVAFRIPALQGTPFVVSSSQLAHTGFMEVLMTRWFLAGLAGALLAALTFVTPAESCIRFKRPGGSVDTGQRAPADAPPLVRLQGATYATAIAEHFRDQGRHVLLLMDSLTRYAMAQREIALAIGEPPATKGYPPSVFAKLPALVERSGNGLQGNGSITAFYTVLTEGDDPQDPIADAARGILDGHIVLSRELAEAGHFPAIDVEKSISRVMGSVADRGHVAAARRARQMLARYNKARDLIQLGAYTPGHDAELDLAVKLHPPLTAMLQQDMHDRATLPASLKQLATLVPNA